MNILGFGFCHNPICTLFGPAILHLGPYRFFKRSMTSPPTLPMMIQLDKKWHLIFLFYRAVQTEENLGSKERFIRKVNPQLEQSFSISKAFKGIYLLKDPDIPKLGAGL
jgi:hypothetical protein